MTQTLTTSETTHMEITCLPQPIDNQHKTSKTTKTSCRLQLCDPYFKPHMIFIYASPNPPSTLWPNPPFLFGGGSGNKTTMLHERWFLKQYVLGHILSLLSMVGGGEHVLLYFKHQLLGQNTWSNCDVIFDSHEVQQSWTLYSIQKARGQLGI